MNNESEFIYGLVGINIILLLTCVVLQFKVFRLSKETDELLKEKKRLQKQHEKLIKSEQEFWN